MTRCQQRRSVPLILCGWQKRRCTQLNRFLSRRTPTRAARTRACKVNAFSHHVGQVVPGKCRLVGDNRFCGASLQPRRGDLAPRRSGYLGGEAKTVVEPLLPSGLGIVRQQMPRDGKAPGPIGGEQTILRSRQQGEPAVARRATGISLAVTHLSCSMRHLCDVGVGDAVCFYTCRGGHCCGQAARARLDSGGDSRRNWISEAGSSPTPQSPAPRWRAL